MTVYRMHSECDGMPHDTRYFAAKERAIEEAQHLAEIFAAMYRVQMHRADVNEFGIVTVWHDHNGNASYARYEIRIDQGEVES